MLSQKELLDYLKISDIKYQAIIDCCKGNLEEIKATVLSLNNQQYLPERIILVHTNGQGEETFNLLKEMSGDITPKWILEEFLEDREDWRDDIILKYRKNVHLFTFIDPGLEFSPSFFQDLNNDITKNDLRFGIIEGEKLLIVTYGTYFTIFNESPLRYIIDEIENTNIKKIKYEYSDTKNV